MAQNTQPRMMQLKQMEVGKANELRTVPEGMTLGEYRAAYQLAGVDISVNANSAPDTYVLQATDKILVKTRFQAGR